MKTIFSILPVIALCATLSACGGGETSTTSTSDTTTLNGSPLGNTANDNTGTGIEGGTVNTGPTTDGSTGTGTGTSTGAGTGTGTGTNMGNESSNAASGSTVGGTGGGTTGTTGGTTSGVGGGSRTNTNRTGARSDYPVKITKEDSVNNRSGLAPVK